MHPVAETALIIDAVILAVVGPLEMFVLDRPAVHHFLGVDPLTSGTWGCGRSESGSATCWGSRASPRAAACCTTDTPTPGSS